MISIICIDCNIGSPDLFDRESPVTTRSLKSLFSQKEEVEIVIVCESDSPYLNNLQKYLDEAHKLKVIQVDAASTFGESMRLGYEASSGDLVTFVDFNTTISADFAIFASSIYREAPTDIISFHLQIKDLDTSKFVTCRRSTRSPYAKRAKILSTSEVESELLATMGLSVCGLVFARKLLNSYGADFTAKSSISFDPYVLELIFSAQKIADSRWALVAKEFSFSRVFSNISESDLSIFLDEIETCSQKHESDLAEQYIKTVTAHWVAQASMVLFDMAIDYQKGDYSNLAQLVYSKNATIIQNLLGDEWGLDKNGLPDLSCNHPYIARLRMLGMDTLELTKRLTCAQNLLMESIYQQKLLEMQVSKNEIDELPEKQRKKRRFFK